MRINLFIISLLMSSLLGHRPSLVNTHKENLEITKITHLMIDQRCLSTERTNRGTIELFLLLSITFWILSNNNKIFIIINIIKLEFVSLLERANLKNYWSDLKNSFSVR
jgi:hypothetical protein